MIDDMIDSAKIAGASWIAKFMWTQKDTSETIKLSNLGSFMLLFLIIENGKALRIVVLLINFFF